jgi:hypothetical protein
MTTNRSERRSPWRGDGRPATRSREYMIAPAVAGTTVQNLIDQLDRSGGVQIVRTHAEQSAIAPPVCVALMSEERAAALSGSAAGTLVIEPNAPLRAAELAGLSLPLIQPGAALRSIGPNIEVAIQVLTDDDQPLEGAEVQIFGEQSAAQGVTGPDGNVRLLLRGEWPETVTAVLVRPPSGCWGLWWHRPELRADVVNTVRLQRLALNGEADWGGRAMGLDRLPDRCRGAGAKIALLDHGIATSHPQLARISRGIDVRASDQTQASRWAEDSTGYGTPCAGIVGAALDATRLDATRLDATHGVRGFAPDAELHICKLPSDARLSDLIPALDYCIRIGVDVACLTLGSRQSSVIVEQRVTAAKQRGVAVIAAAGNSAGPVQFPACSPQVMAVGAVGQIGSYPEDSLQALQAVAATPIAGGFFVPPFSCQGPELDLCAPGAAVIACQSPDGYGACDGTSLAASHVAALGALIVAHHGDFRGDFVIRDVRRVERLFQILKDTAQPIGLPWQTGAGLPDAARALGLPSRPWTAEAPLNVELQRMRQAMHQAMRQARHQAIRSVDATCTGLGRPTMFEPPRGAATVTRWPLNQNPPAMMFETTAAEGGLHALKAAMTRAGLVMDRGG